MDYILFFGIIPNYHIQKSPDNAVKAFFQNILYMPYLKIKSCEYPKYQCI